MNSLLLFNNEFFEITSVPSTVLNPDPSKEWALKLSSESLSFGEHLVVSHVKKARN